jgi:hypothetical protein
MKNYDAQIPREYGPFAGGDSVGGVTYDGKRIWFAAGKLNALDPATGEVMRSMSPVMPVPPLMATTCTRSWKTAS